ncbi:multidrug export protein EmrA [Achromobacter aloeverae]|uniref:Multidrug export protein EmrA n=2 Tax=Achromobacter aloeverae TaxID=1750518 RepID=A0A4Q1HKH2_9BURK|nr:multidrug export protein EmrA [Achromobacter aloeverae]
MAEETEHDPRAADQHGHEAGRRDDARDDGERRDRRGSQDGGGRDDGGRENGGQDSDNKDNGNHGRKRGKKPLIILGIVALVLVVGGVVWWFLTRNQVSTDDAYTEGNAVTIAPKVGGYVVQLSVDDNTRVKKGDLLLRIDPRDYVAARDQALAQRALAAAQLNQARTQLALARVQYPAQLSQARAQEKSAQANLANAQASYRRQRSVDPRATSQQNVDAATAQQRTALAEVANAQAQVQAADVVQQQVDQAQALVRAREAQLQAADAQVEQAELNLSYTEVHAPSDGWVTRRNVNVGSLLQAGATVFALVPPTVWVTANFKETQLDRMRPGNAVDIDVDAYPRLKLHGHVDSIQLGTGSRFSAFPAENATGNFVKIVQRVPVKIVIDSGMDPDLPLPLGLSVVPTVVLQ